MSRRRPLRFLGYGLLSLTLGLSLAVTGAEIWARVTGLDMRLVANSLWWQTVDLALHRVSADPFLQYELAPETSLRGLGPWGPTSSSVNAQGARGGPASCEKPPGTLRLLCFGGSSMFGAGVSDHQTVCARLARRLEAQGVEPPRVQAWNFGADAYNLAQMSHLALARIEDLGPDVIVVLLSNTGRRAFLLTERVRQGDYGELRGMDGLLHEENLPHPPWLSPSLHHLALAHLALYRAWAGQDALARHGTGPESDIGDALSREVAARLTAACAQRRLPLLYAGIPASLYRASGDVHLGLEPAQFLDLADNTQPPVYNELHPPPAILDEWARRIAVELLARGMVSPAAVTVPPGAAQGPGATAETSR